jgi:anti-anti-sigma regulatory factor
MLRITTETTNEGTVIKLEGKLAGAWVSEVERAWLPLVGDRFPQPVLVDLCGVTFIDADGKRLLRRMGGEGAAFRCSGPDITATVEEIESEAVRRRLAH